MTSAPFSCTRFTLVESADRFHHLGMRLYSTNSPDLRVDFGEAVLRSLPADNGLYMPESIPQLGDDFWENWRGMSFQEMASRVVSTLL